MKTDARVHTPTTLSLRALIVRARSSRWLNRPVDFEMTGARLTELPAPPQGKSGWPWTEEPPPLPESMPGGQTWPRISVVMPSYNQGEFIEQALRSVLLQGYPALEFIVIDGGSTDATRDIISKYAAHLSYWISEPDMGQSHAINKGFSRTTGQIMCWLNSDDFHLPETLQTVAEKFAGNAGTFALAGHVLKVYADGRAPQILAGRFESLPRLLQFWRGYHMHQPSIFWRREVFETVGPLDESQHFIMDFDYWVRIARRFGFTNVDRVLSCVTYHGEAKTGDDYARYHRELRQQSPRFWGSPRSATYWYLKLSMTWHFVAQPFRRRLQPLVGRAGWVSSRILRRSKMMFGGGA